MDNGKPITRQEMVELLTTLENSLEGRLDAKLNQRLAEQEERLREYVHDTETRLLRAFHTFAENIAGRVG